MKWPSIPLKSLLTGPALHHYEKDEQNMQYEPFKIISCFRPSKVGLYKCKFRFLVEEGIGIDIVLKGEAKLQDPDRLK